MDLANKIKYLHEAGIIKINQFPDYNTWLSEIKLVDPKLIPDNMVNYYIDKYLDGPHFYVKKFLRENPGFAHTWKEQIPLLLLTTGIYYAVEYGIDWYLYSSDNITWKKIKPKNHETILRFKNNLEPQIQEKIFEYIKKIFNQPINSIKFTGEFIIITSFWEIPEGTIRKINGFLSELLEFLAKNFTDYNSWFSQISKINPSVIPGQLMDLYIDKYLNKSDYIDNILADLTNYKYIPFLLLIYSRDHIVNTGVDYYIDYLHGTWMRVKKKIYKFIFKFQGDLDQDIENKIREFINKNFSFIIKSLDFHWDIITILTYSPFNYLESAKIQEFLAGLSNYPIPGFYDYYSWLDGIQKLNPKLIPKDQVDLYINKYLNGPGNTYINKFLETNSPRNIPFLVPTSDMANKLGISWRIYQTGNIWKKIPVTE